MPCTQAVIAPSIYNVQTDLEVVKENPLAPSLQEFRRSNETPSSLACQEVHKSGKENLSSHFSEQIVYNQSVKRSGNVIKSKRYTEFQRRGYEKKNLVEKKKAKITDPEQKKKNALKSGRRAKDKLIDLINSNFGLRSRVNAPGRKSVKFLTLTYKQEVEDLNQVHDDFAKFIDRLEYELGEKVEQLTVPEIQKEREEKTGFAVWHLHPVLYCGYIDGPRKGHANGDTWLERNWNKKNGQGSFTIERIRDINNLGKYVAKYVSKTFLDEGLEGKHRYWCSEGLKDKTVKLYARVEPGKGMTHQELMNYFDGYIVSMRQGFYSGEYTGQVDYLDLTLKPCPEVEFLCQNLETSFQWLSSWGSWNDSGHVLPMPVKVGGRVPNRPGKRIWAVGEGLAKD